MSLKDICAALVSPRKIRHRLLRHLLAISFPPLFKPHPKLNPATGRVLNRPRGGERGILDWYEESEGEDVGWRNEAGMGNVIKVVVSSLEVRPLSFTSAPVELTNNPAPH